MGFVSYWTDWLGMTGLITSLITVLIIIMAFFYAYFDDINWGIFYMSCASLVGIFASMAIWFRRVEEDGCDPCVKSILQKVAKDAADKAVASYGAKAE